MATLSHSLSYLSFISHTLYLSQNHHHHHHRLNWNPPRQQLTFTICACSGKKSSRSSGSRKVKKSNEELRDEIREFLCSVGLPEGHVPSMKELSEHGRSDLANIVRRRGYKLIGELLTSSAKTDFDALIEDKNLADNDNGISNETAAKESNGVNEGEDAIEVKSRTPGAEHLEHAYDNEVYGAIISSRSALTSKQIDPTANVNYPLRGDRSAAEGLIGADFDEDLDVETSKRENQLEVSRLKFMLHQKELELSRLKEHIEKEKLALSVLQTKAETEINKAQKLISVKDAELQAAEESLSGLEEVQLQFFGEGEIVEVAGSFNGWHHRIKMDPQPSSSFIEPIGSRKSRLWSTVLWLYPGTYEIKFIIDGQWRIDSQRESVTSGGMCNNILRVER